MAEETKRLEDITLIEAVNLNPGHFIRCEDGVLSRDYAGFQINMGGTGYFDARYRVADPRDIESFIQRVHTNKTLRYFCDTKAFYIGRNRIDLAPKVRLLHDMLFEETHALGLTLLTIGERDLDLFSPYYPFLVDNESFQQCLAELNHREGERLWQNFTSTASIGSDGVLTQRWSMFSAGSTVEEVKLWLASSFNYGADDCEEYLINRETNKHSLPMV